VVRMEGKSESIKANGEIKAQLAGLAKQLADLGISGAGNYSSEQFQGVLREDLAGAVKQSSDCKLAVFNKLEEKMIK
jgi:hypothetical protein